VSFNNLSVFFLLCGVVVLLSLEWLRPLRRCSLLALSCVFIARFYFGEGGNPGWLFFLAGFTAVHYGVLQILLRLGSQRARKGVYYAWLAAAIFGFLFVKQYTWLIGWFLPGSESLLREFNLFLSRGNPALPVFTLGLSFLIFRQIHMAVEIRDGMLKEVGLLDYLTYMFAFWTFNAGPMQRFEPFCAEYHGLPVKTVSATDTLIGLNRVMFGYLKMFVAGAWFGGLATPETYTRHPDAPHMLLFLAAYPLFIYMNFTGYCDIVIGVARAVGFTLPENFRQPLLARNMVDFWNRWHITLSEFFRDYMYLPIYTSLRRRMPQLLAMSITSLLAFFVMGMWHGNTVMMAAYGLMHGTGIVVSNLYGELLKRRLTREQLKSYRQNRVIQTCAVVLCQCYVAAAYLIFAYNTEQLSQVFPWLFQRHAGS
jgi:D-alanyl-lipoteichoic acid acyltransferase DltB (MBOAT superfamily)